MYLESNEIAAQGMRLSANLKHCDVLVLDAELRPSLAAIRSLGQRGLSVAGFCANNTSSVPAFSSRWCQQKIVSWAGEGTQEYLVSLEQVVRATSPKLIMAFSDGTISLIRRHRELLEQHTHVALAQESLLEVALNGARVLEIARELGLNILKGVHIKDLSEIDEAMRVVGLPALVKPAESWDAEKCVRLDSKLVVMAEEARTEVEALLNAGIGVIFQQFLPGPRESLSFFFAHGEICARFASQTKRASTQIGRTDVLRRSINVPEDSGEQAERLLQFIGMDGYCRVDFRRDYAGKPYIMDIDPCLSTGTELALQAGVDFSHLLYQWTMGEPIEKVQGYRTGAWRRDLGGDFVALMATIRQANRPYAMPRGRAVRDFCASFFVPTGYDYLDWRDLGPAWSVISGRFSSIRSKGIYSVDESELQSI